MAYKSRFSFWEQKVKVENKPDSDVDSSQPQAVTKPGLDAGSGPQSTASTAEASKTNITMVGPDPPGEEQSSSGKKVVRVVRRVVRRVVPAGTGEQNQPPVPEAAMAVPKPTKAPGEDKDDISMGLTSLMGRSRTKEHRPRTRTQDRKEDVKEEVRQEEEKGKVEEEEEKPTVEKTKEAEPTPVPTTSASNPAPLKSNPLIPPAGFIPPPKPDPLPPPAGFLPVSRQNLLTPPPGFIPARKSSPVPPKQNHLARPPGFIPVPKTDSLAPPAGFIPKPRTFGVKKPEVKETSCPPVAPNGKPSLVSLPQAQSAPNEQVPQLVPSEEDYKRVKRIFTVNGNDVTSLALSLFGLPLQCFTSPVTSLSQALASPDRENVSKESKSHVGLSRAFPLPIGFQLQGSPRVLAT